VKMSADEEVLVGKNDKELLEDLSRKTYKAQAVWFLNGFWDKLTDEDKRTIWAWKHKCDELDLDKKAEGNALDELNAHRLLEFFHQAMTVQEMRDVLRKTGAIGDKVKLVPLIHFLIVKYKLDFHVLVHAPQGSKQAIAEAQRRLEAVQTAFREAEEKAQEARAALKEAEAKEADAKKTEADAKAREADAKAREAEAKAAQAELEAALHELKTQEDAYNNKTSDLKRKSEDESSTVVARNKAKNELAQHLGEDPLPLRRAKINQEAAVRKAERATKAAAEARATAEAARAAAEKSRVAAEQARRASEEATRVAEAAVDEAAQRVEEAEQFLEEVKKKGGGEGALWWIEQELHEAKAYMPSKKGGYAKNKVF